MYKLKETCEMIMGEQEQFEYVLFDGFEELLDLGNRLLELSNQYEDGCIYVCDLMNGTPFNASAYAIANTDNVILSGASVPMVMELLITRNNSEGSPEEIAKQILESSENYITLRHSRDFFE